LGYRKYKLRHKIIKLILKVAVLAFLVLVGIIVVGIIYAMNYQGQVYDAFQRIVNFIFGDNLVNVLKCYLKLIIDSVIKGLFSGG
jgi:multisubunit Na+/H+ antiporter MnhB subunit